MRPDLVPPKPGQYSEATLRQLRAIRYHRRMCLLSLFGGGVVGVLVQMTVIGPNSNDSWGIMTCGTTGGILSFYHGFMFGFRTCPMCGNLFFIKKWYRSEGWVNKCVHCGLPLNPKQH